MDTVTRVMSAVEPTNETSTATPRESERKFVVSPLVAGRFLARIESRTALEIADPARPVEFNRTTYFDTADLAFLRSSRTGLARKLRVREYASACAEGVPPEPTRAFLELKESGGGFRSKTRVRLDATIAALLETAPESPSLSMFRRLFAEQRPVPMLTTRYRRVRRNCLESPVRVTVDSEVCFMTPVEPGSPIDFRRRAVRFSHAIVEVKAASEIPPWLLAELDPASEEGTFSKFEHGMRLLGELA